MTFPAEADPYPAAAPPPPGIAAPHGPRDYRAWRERKLAGRDAAGAGDVVEVSDPLRPSAAEIGEIVSRCRRHNLAVYACGGTARSGREAVRALAAALGLCDADRTLRAPGDDVAAIRVGPHRAANEYVPYTDRALGWHTDGCYNPPAQPVRGVLMHCERPAAAGGENRLLDPELVYIRVRDADPGHVAALGRADALGIPANRDGGRTLRPASHGPVFSSIGGHLHMRYTARRRFVEWHADPAVRAAAAFLRGLLEAPGEDALEVRLEAGMGIVCNNALHARAAFADAPGDTGRLLWRGRYRQRVAGT